MTDQLLDDPIQEGPKKEAPKGVTTSATLYYWLLWLLVPLGLLEYCVWVQFDPMLDVQIIDCQRFLMVLLVFLALWMSVQVWSEKDPWIKVYLLVFGVGFLVDYNFIHDRLFDPLWYNLEFWETTLSWSCWWFLLVPIRYFRLKTGDVIWKALERAVLLYLLAVLVLHGTLQAYLNLGGGLITPYGQIVQYITTGWLVLHLVLLLYEVRQWSVYPVAERLLWGSGWLLWGGLLFTQVYRTTYLYGEQLHNEKIFMLWGATVFWAAALAVYYGIKAQRARTAEA